jgi:hypothetical protein
LVSKFNRLSNSTVFRAFEKRSPRLVIAEKERQTRADFFFFAEIKIAGSIDSQNFSIRINKAPIGT